MSDDTELETVRVESAEAVLGLHWFVARDHTAEQEGIEIEITVPEKETFYGKDDERTWDHRKVESTHYQDTFERGDADIYRACQWGQMRRAADDPSGPIVSKRAAVVNQGIFVQPDSDIDHPKDLANTTVGVQWHQGSHYTTRQMLEGALRDEEIKLANFGTVPERFEALQNGEVPAATLMEPWITLAERKGYKKITETHYAGVENTSVDVDDETWEGLQRSISEAVDLIQQDPTAYVHYMLDEISDKYSRQIDRGDFNANRLRYVEPEPFTEEEFQREFEWMVEHDMIDPNADYDELVLEQDVQDAGAD